MKKAKEYAQEIINTYIEQNQDAALVKAAQTVKDLFTEVSEITQARNITRYQPMLAVLKEQHVKWISICKHVNKEINLLNDQAFLQTIEQEMTMIYPNLLKIL
jgi:hypothetical protein